MTKIELFKKYIEKFFKDMQEKCVTKENYNDPETCNDNEIRKWKYFYDNPRDYILFYDEKGKNSDIVTYLIQQVYPSYQSSGFLNIKYFICLLLLFSFLINIIKMVFIINYKNDYIYSFYYEFKFNIFIIFPNLL